MTNIFVGSITSYDSTTGQYYIRLQGSSLDTTIGVPARTLSPTPYEGGAGIKSAPIAPVDSQCMVAKQGNRYYILGFLSPHGLVAHGDVKPVRDINPGDIFLTHSTPSKLGILAEGTILMAAAKWAKATLSPLTQQLTMTVRNIRLNLYTMIVEYFADEANKKSTARIAMGKWINPAGLSLLPPDGSSPVTPDNFTLQAGTLADSHILELNINQKYLGTDPQSVSNTLVGLQKDGTYFSHNITNKTPDGSSFNLSLQAKNNGSLTSRLEKAGANYIETTCDVSNDTGKPGLSINISGKTKVTIGKNGDVTFTTSPGANIKFGGTGNEQPLVTKAFIDQYYTKHTHSNGNQGAPTGFPIIPVQPLSMDSNTNPITFTTQAE